MLLKRYTASLLYPTHSLTVENPREYPKFIQEEEIKQSEYYADKISDLVEDLKTALKETVNVIARWGKIYFDTEIGVRIFGYDFDIRLRDDLLRFKAELLKAIKSQMKLLKERAPERCDEILRFIDKTLNEEISDKIFSKVWQGTGSNEFVKIITSKNTPVDPFKNTITIKKGDFELVIESSNPNTIVRTSTHKLLDILMLTYLETREKEVTISIQDFMKLRGLKDRKTAEEQVKEDLATLYSLSVSFRQKEEKKIVAYDDIRIIQGKGQALKNGIIRVKFGDDFFNAMQSYHIMPMPPAFLALNDRHNPNSYHLGRKIALHKNMNYWKANADLISINTLLEACPNLRTHEEVHKEGNYKYKEKIIAPFERDMNALEETGIFTWEYCHSNGMPLSNEELEMNYEIFKKLLVKITWHIYPAREIKTKEKKPKARSRKTNKQI